MRRVIQVNRSLEHAASSRKTVRKILISRSPRFTRQRVREREAECANERRCDRARDDSVRDAVNAFGLLSLLAGRRNRCTGA